MSRSRVTIRDVAAQAGVSHQTVSRVINSSASVSPETRAKVQAAIEELGYRPNAIARSMARGHTRTLGCISPNLTNYVFSSMIESAQAQARSLGFFTLTGSAPAEEEFKLLLEEMLYRRVDGLLILNPRDDGRYHHIKPLVHKGMPVVYVKNTSGNDPVSSVSCDDIEGGYKATKHLLELGHTDIVTIPGPENEECTPDRLEGYQKALTEAGIKPSEGLIVSGDWSAKSGGFAVKQLFESGISFSAIFAQNDRMAIGAIRALREAGIQVPQDVSVIGYDDIPLSSFFDPPLTTMRQPMDKFGQCAAQLLIDAIQDRDHPLEHVRIHTQLVERMSCAPRKA